MEHDQEQRQEQRQEQEQERAWAELEVDSEKRMTVAIRLSKQIAWNYMHSCVLLLH